MTTLSHDAVSTIVRETVEGQLPGVTIVSVNTEDDPDDESIFLATIVFDAGGSRLDPERTVGLTSDLLSSLRNAGEDRVPITSLVSRADAEQMPGAA